MEAQQPRRSTSATSRRELHRRRPSKARRAASRSLPKLAVVCALAAATIVVPVGHTLNGEVGGISRGSSAVVAGPSTFEVLSETMPTTLGGSRLLAAPGSRSAAAASRAVERTPLPGCDGTPSGSAANGQMPESDLCTIWDGTSRLRADAALALTELNENFAAAFERDLCITGGYRTLAAQRRLAATKPGLAATPGKSNHGYGLAIDLCSSETGSSRVMSWLRQNGPVYGWVNPRWAQRGGSGPYEPWHWEYEPGTRAMGTDYTS